MNVEEELTTFFGRYTISKVVDKRMLQAAYIGKTQLEHEIKEEAARQMGEEAFKLSEWTTADDMETSTLYYTLSVTMMKNDDFRDIMRYIQKINNENKGLRALLEDKKLKEEEE